ncbi:MAG: hypothetical protein KDA63_18230 [Planctomycetales bacterium]|nr:hypothetical protein [Planctomycetales bacterium]
MSTANKWLLGFLIFFTLVMFVVSMMVLNMESKWHATVASLKKKQEQLGERLDTLERGSEQQPGVVQLRHQAALLLADRGRAWYDVTPQQVQAETGEVRVGNLATPTGISENLIVYVFQQRGATADGAEQPGAYLGRFQVTDIAEGQVVLVPQPKLRPEQLQRLAASPGPWAMYDLMPRDSHDIFAGMSEEQLKAMLPESSASEFLDDGKPHDADRHPADRRDEDGNFVRPLRDYATLFEEMNRMYVIQNDRIASVQADLAAVQQSIEQSRVQEEFTRSTIAQLTTELAEAQRRRDAVVAMRDDLDAKLATVRGKIEETLNENRRLAEAWIQLQFEELSRIEQASQTASTSPEPTAAIAP